MTAPPEPTDPTFTSAKGFAANMWPEVANAVRTAILTFCSGATQTAEETHGQDVWEALGEVATPAICRYTNVTGEGRSLRTANSHAKGRAGGETTASASV